MGGDEKTIAQLKTFHSVPTQTYAANSAWQQLVVLAHNLLTNFQLETGAPAAAPHPEDRRAPAAACRRSASVSLCPPRWQELRMSLPTRQTFTPTPS